MTSTQQVRNRSWGSIVGWILLVPSALLWLWVLFVAAAYMASGPDAEDAGAVVGRLAFPWILAAAIRFGWVKLVRKDGRPVFVSPWTVVIAAVAYLLMVAGAAGS